MRTPRIFGRWTVLKTYPGGHSIGTMCTCKCTCGTIREVPRKRLVHGTSQSCGCARGRDIQTTISDLQELAQKNGGACLSKRYQGHHARHSWRCAQRHVWEATTNSVKQGSWCPKCVGSQEEQFCRRVLETLFSTSFESAFPSWLVNPRTGRRLQLDGYSPGLRIAFEYQGAQHYKKVPRYHRGKNDLETLQQRDRYKVATCLEHGVALLVIPTFPDGFSIETGITSIQHVITTAELTPTGSLKGFHFTSRSKAEDYKLRVEKAASTRGWTLSSNNGISAHAKAELICGEGHHWVCRVTDLLHGKTKCPGCREKIRRRDYKNRVRSAIEDAELTLITQGDIYSETKVEMRCPQEHPQQWRAARILSRSVHCVECQRTSISSR